MFVNIYGNDTIWKWVKAIRKTYIAGPKKFMFGTNLLWSINKLIWASQNKYLESYPIKKLNPIKNPQKIGIKYQTWNFERFTILTFEITPIQYKCVLCKKNYGNRRI